MHKFVVGIVAVVTVIAVSACGSNQALGLSSPASVLAAVTSTTNAKSSKMSVDINAAADGQTADITGDGEFDYTNHDGELTLNIPAIGTEPAGTLSEIIVDQTLYAKGDQDPKWAKVDLSQVAQQTGISQKSLTQNEADPTQGLDMLKGDADNVTKVGTETVRGTKTTHYTANLDFDKAANNASGAQKVALEKVATAYNHQTIPAGVWVDSQNRVRRLTLTVDLSKLAVTTSTTQPVTGTLTVTEELYDFGTPVNVSAPPADQVQDVTSQATTAAKQQAS